MMRSLLFFTIASLAATIISLATTPVIQCDPVLSLSFCKLSCACSCTTNSDGDFLSCKPTETNCPEDEAIVCEQGCHCSSDRHTSQLKIMEGAEKISEEQWREQQDEVLAETEKAMRGLGKDGFKKVQEQLREVEEKRKAQSVVDRENRLRIDRERQAILAPVADWKERVIEQNKHKVNGEFRQRRPTVVSSKEDGWLFGGGDPAAAGTDEGDYKGEKTPERFAALLQLVWMHRVIHQHEEGEIFDEKCEGTCLCKCGGSSFVCESKSGCEKVVDSWSEKECKLGCMCSCGGTANHLICNGAKDCRGAVKECWKWGCDEEKTDL